jgi:carboxymethylenebutenolidase
MRASTILTLAAISLVPLPALAQGAPEHAHDHGTPDTAAAAPARDANLPADEASAKDALEHSPRHGEYIDVPMPGGGTPIRTWIVYPERKDKAPVVLIIHEIFGLSDWIRAVADQFAREGFIAVAPDLLSGLGPNGGGTESLPGRDSVVAVIRRVTPAMAWARLDAVRAWALALPSANGRCGTTGFCWGGTRSFDYATVQPALDAAVVFYGTSPDSASLLKLKAPVLGLYGGDDARVNATIDPAKQVLGPLKKSYEVHLFDGAGHGFLRQQTGREGANLKATQEAWPRAVAFLKGNLKPKK